MEEVQFAELDPARFRSVLDAERIRRFERQLASASRSLEGRTLWHLNSTAEGGGVAEMLQSVLGYLRGAGIETRWLVIDGNEEFFEVTKRIHNLLHGEPGDDGPLGSPERDLYRRVMEQNVAELEGRVGPGDVVVLHDPQTVGLAGPLKDVGTTLVWACHVGVDEPNDRVRTAWDFLRPHVDATDVHVFSRPAYSWEGLSESKTAVIPPCIDAFSPKNQSLEKQAIAATLEVSGVIPQGVEGEARFMRLDGSTGTVGRQAEMVQDEPVPSDAPIVVQVSRWDRLKDPAGVLRGFAEHGPQEVEAHLVLAGPAAHSVTDDPEGGEVLSEVEKSWEDLSGDIRRRIHIACLPMDDLEENAAMVNALQRRADVIVQKSIAEGFGLTVAEGMWKGRPTVGSRVGGIQDQIVHEESGLLVDDPEDLAAFGHAVSTLLLDADLAAEMGRNAHARVCDEYLAPVYLGRHLALIQRVMGKQRQPPTASRPRKTCF